MSLSQMDISVRLAQNGVTIKPNAADAISDADDPEAVIDAIIDADLDDTITVDHVDDVLTTLDADSDTSTTEEAESEDTDADDSAVDAADEVTVVSADDLDWPASTVFELVEQVARQSPATGQVSQAEVAGKAMNYDLDPDQVDDAVDQLIDEGVLEACGGDAIRILQDDEGDDTDTTDGYDETETDTNAEDDSGSGDTADASGTSAAGNQDAKSAHAEQNGDDDSDSVADEMPPVTRDPEDLPDDAVGVNDAGAPVNEHGEPVGETVAERWPNVYRELFDHDRPAPKPRASDKREYTIEGDITDQSTCEGVIEDFNSLFKSRYEKERDILESRVMPSPISSLQNSLRGGDDVEVIGMVRRTWTSRNGNAMVEVEDTTGTMRAVFTDEDEQEKCEKLVEDEVVGLVGQLSDDAGIIFGDELHFPDVPHSHRPNTADRSVKVAFISDVHLGADTFAYDKWTEFVDWVRENDDIEYLLIGGDLVEGIGVYPDQDEELDVIDIYDQYELCAKALDELPDDLEIISIVGNHDTGTRLAEPQPQIEDHYIDCFGDNVTIVGNPATVTIEGVSVLMYHGMSLNSLDDHITPVDLDDDPTSVMQMMLEKRHLAPIFGTNVRLAPEHEDHMVIDEVPDIFHTGHVHLHGVDTFRGVLMMNTSTWQYQTDFQAQRDINPDVGYVTVVDLKDHDYEVVEF